jgi:putative ABC transport system permease protein
MRAILTQVRAAVLRRRAQTATALLLSLMATTVSTMALTLLVRSTQPFDDAFASLSGPHLVFHLDVTRVTPAQLQATSKLPGVTAAGPVNEIALSSGRGSQVRMTPLASSEDVTPGSAHQPGRVLK